MPKFYMICEEDYAEYASEEAAIEAAKNMNASGMIVRAVAKVEWEHPDPIFIVKIAEEAGTK